MAGEGRDDRGHILVLEAVMVAAILLTAAAFVANRPKPGESRGAEEAASAALARDVLLVLEGRPAPSPYKNLLHQFVTEAVRGDASKLTNYLDRTLPVGADYGIYLDNGEAPETVHETGTPTGVVTSESVVFYPDWNYAMVFATMDRQPGADALTTMRVKVVPVQHSYLDRDASGSVVFDNGVVVPLVAGADGVFVADDVPPEHPAAPQGFEVPYDTTDALAHAASVAGFATASPAAYGVNTTLPYATVTPIVYRVHPTYVVDATLQTFLESQPRVSTGATKFRPGESVAVTYDFAGLPLGLGWTVQSREIRVYGPVLGNEVASETLPALSGTWTFDLPRDAMYGTYVVEVRLGLADGSVVQTVHDVTAFDVLRKGVDEPVPPVYRAVLAVWFPGLD